MKSRFAFSALLLLLSSSLFAQTQINSSFPFQSDPDKKYSVVIPSGYSAATPSKVMLGLHPFNTARWNGQTWCEYLVEFAEGNNLILVCPDGGADGRIDDPIDMDFTTFLLDSVAIWYSIQPEKVYAMGFSWGGRTTYTYGLSHTDRLHGFIPIGAAMNGLSIDNVAANAADQPFYLIHGGNDNLGGNFNPYKEILEDNGAILNSKVLPGVGHTIDFANNMAILTEAFRWIDSVNCDTSTSTGFFEPIEKMVDFWTIAPNPIKNNQPLQIQWTDSEEQPISIALYDTQGQLLQRNSEITVDGQQSFSLDITNRVPGIYYISIVGKGGKRQAKRLLIGQ